MFEENMNKKKEYVRNKSMSNIESTEMRPTMIIAKN
jgi:hypothetical protein